MLDGTGMEKVSLTQYARLGWREKSLFTENARQGWYKKSLKLICWVGLTRKTSFHWKC